MTPKPSYEELTATEYNSAEYFVSFSLDGQWYALPLSQVEQSLRMVALVAVPESPPWISGLLNLHGRVIPVLDLRNRFGLSPKPLHKDDRLLVVGTNGRTIAIIADELGEVLEVPDGQTEKPPESLSQSPALKSIIRHDNEFIDLVFLAMAWEYFGKPNLNLKLWLRAFLTLLGVMWLDVLLFATGAFAGTPAYLSIMKGTLISRFIISIFALPFLYGYLYWQSRKKGVEIENRPVLAILKQVAEIELELSHAQQKIEKRKKAENERDKVIQELKKALSEVKTLRGFLPICSICKNVRDDQGYWSRIESYIRDHSEAEFSHSICPECAKKHYPDLDVYDD